MLSLNHDATDRDDRNARFLAHACRLAYRPEAEGTAAYRDELGLEARLISVGNTQAWLLQDDRTLAVAFRGSEAPTSIDGLKDWLLTNANNLLILPEGRLGTDFAAAGVGARFHRGFMQALADVWDPLAAAVDAAVTARERPLWITGHSLGGALALLASWRFHQQFRDIQAVYTFGAPMIGNAATAEAFQRELGGKIFRYVDEPDPVPLLPMVSMLANSYNHCPAEVRLKAAAVAGAAAADATPASAAMHEISTRAVSGVLNLTLIDEVWAYVLKRLGAHDIANYLKLIGDRCR